MGWPLSQDYNEAVQSPDRNFADADLRRGEAVVNALGLPQPLSGNFADVYEIRCPDGPRWAVKCFTREVPGLRERYREVSAHLRRARLPFMVDFAYLDEGVRAGGRWYPVLKMPWVEGLTLNQFVALSAEKPATLLTLAQIWARMSRHLRAARVAHGDLQHGNVLLVREADTHSLAIKLVDYDGLWVPALAANRSGEVGHPAYQHPERLRRQNYGPEVDRFPVLLIAAALRGVQMGGPALWQKYGDADNLLFRQQDLESPAKSRLFYDLLKLNDPTVRLLTDALIEAARKPLEQTPLLDDLLPAAEPLPVRPPPRDAVKPAAPETWPEGPTPVADGPGHFSEISPRWLLPGRIAARRRPWQPAAVAAGVALALFVVLGAVLYLAARGGPARPGPTPLALNRPRGDDNTRRPGAGDPRPPGKPPPRAADGDEGMGAGAIDPPADDGAGPARPRRPVPPGKGFPSADPPPAPKGLPPPGGTDDARLAVPAAASLAAAERDVRELYRDDYARRGLAERQALARRLLRDGLDVKGKPAAQFVMLREARDLAAAVEDYTLAYQAAELLARHFAVRASEMKATVLEVAGRNSTTSAGCVMLVGGALDLIERTVAEDDYEPAARALAVARTAADRSKDRTLIARVRGYGDRLTAVRQEFGGLGDTIRTLRARPDDPAANLRLGRFYCFCKGHWDRGLPFLARGGDAKLRALARQELAGPAKPEARRQLADGWWDRIPDAANADRRLIRLHAYQWYLSCLPGRDVPDGAEIDRRLRRLAEDAPGAEGPLDDLNVPPGKLVDGAARLAPRQELASRRLYAGAVEVDVIARTAGNNLRLRGPRGSALIFNWEGKAGELRVHRPDGNERSESGSLAVSKPCPLTAEQWYVIRWLLTESGMAVSVNDVVVFKEDHRYDLGAREPVRVASVESPVEVRAFSIKRGR